MKKAAVCFTKSGASVIRRFNLAAEEAVPSVVEEEAVASVKRIILW